MVCQAQDMSDRCAVCGADDVWKQHTLPEAWGAYLAEERGLGPPAGYYLLPACRDCSEDVSTQKTLDEALPEMDEDSVTLLDGVDQNALLEEAGD